MRRLLFAAVTVLVSLAASAGIAAAASAPAAKPATAARYVNPFSDPRWIPGRIDMGMDWVPLRKLPVRAVGDAVILGADNHSGWPGHHIIWYQLTDGPLQGDIIYVAEHLTALARAGASVRAGQRIAVAVPGYPYIETGWADAYGSPRAYPCYHEGVATNSGREIARFLGTLGAPLGMAPPRVGARPSGRRC
jgi:murein DD-endopeptidase MepM/ murein hydrolase activator NlpD